MEFIKTIGSSKINDEFLKNSRNDLCVVPAISLKDSWLKIVSEFMQAYKLCRSITFFRDIIL